MALFNGLSSYPAFADDVAQGELVCNIEATPWDAGPRHQSQHYGAKYNTVTRCLEAALPIPKWLEGHAAAVEAITGQPVRQVTIDKYAPGQSDSPRVDNTKMFGPTVAKLCLGQPASMRLARGGQPAITLGLQPGQLVVLVDEMRYKWAHAVANHGPGHHYTITFRGLA